MIVPAGLLATVLALQVPPPDAAAKLGRELRGQERAILEGESRALGALADRLAARGDAQGAAAVRGLLPPASPPDGATRLALLPESVTPRGSGFANVPAGPERSVDAPWKREAESVRVGAAKALFALAVRAGTTQPRELALADACLRGVIARQPDHPEARRLLGYVPYKGGWATPFAVARFQEGMTLHPTYGWVKASWVPHLEKGGLPSRASRPNKEVWLPAAKADKERDRYPGWQIHTEHFDISANVPLREAITFGKHLEALHEVFQSLFAEVIGEKLPLAHRLKKKDMVGEGPVKRHRVSYFPTREEYEDYLRPIEGPGIEGTLGIYLPKARSRPGHAYFFRDANGDLPVTANLYHEVSHQLLFESDVAAPNQYKKNQGNYWVFEGLGCYFETLTISPDALARIGGVVGRRLEEARKNLVVKERTVPLSAFVRFGEQKFKGQDAILYYQEGAALATFLMHGREGAYREGFLEYVRDACRGQLRATAGRSLEARVDTPYGTLEKELLSYLKGSGPG